MGDSVELDFEGPIVELQKKIEELESFAESTEMDLRGQIEQLRRRWRELQREVIAKLSPWQRIQLARHPNRPVFNDYLSTVFEDPIELHGDQAFADDQAMWCGFAKLRGRSIVLIGQRKGKNTKDRIATNFGCAHPEGYRKAMRVMRLAEKFHLPIVTLIDTPGAYPGVAAEERGQAHAIARSIFEMSRLAVPIVCVVIGEGGSGGALGIGVGDRILMLENSYYSVISPEGCSSILWKTADQAPRAAAILKLTATDLFGFGVIDSIIAEPPGGAHQAPPEACRLVADAINEHLKEIAGIAPATLVDKRYEKIRRLGVFIEEGKNGAPPQAVKPVSNGVKPVAKA